MSVKVRVSLGRDRQERILDRDLHICRYCNEDADCVDHVIPYTWLPEHVDDNLVASCTDCNQIASGRIFDSLGEKGKFIREERKKLKWRMRRDERKVPRCNGCGHVFILYKDGSTQFTCGECERNKVCPKNTN